MTFNTIVDSIYQSFLERSASARVILLHNRSRYRTALLSRLLANTETRVFYYAMGSDDVDMQSFVAGFTHDMSDQFPQFGTHVNQAVSRDPRDLERIIDGFIADFKDLSDEAFILILDEFDRTDVGDDLQMLIEMMVDRLPANCKMVLNSRDLPRLPWLSLIAQKKAIMLRDSDLVAENFYDYQEDNNARVSIRAFGPGTVYLDQNVVEGWEGHLPRLLFYFSMERPVVTRSEICAAFWPDLSTEQAVNVFHVTKRRLHKALEGVSMDILVHENGYYRVNTDLSLHYDVIAFVSALVAGRLAENNKQRQQSWQRAMDLYQRPFLIGHNDPWILRRRAEYQMGYLEALAGMAKVRAAEGRPESAMTLLLKAVSEDAKRQDLHREIMVLYTDMGRRSEAASHYQRLQEELGRLKVDMEPETTKLHKELMK
jgi:DNA-binding SARP family transcriptional activator